MKVKKYCCHRLYSDVSSPYVTRKNQKMKKKKKKPAKIEEKSLHISGTTWWASMKLTGKKLIMIKLIAEEKKLGLGILKSTILRKPRRLGNGI